MAAFKEYRKYDALGLAELIKKKKVKPEEICEEAIKQIEEINPHLNAVITPMFQLARERLKEKSLKGGLKGVPFLLKDLLASYAGVPLTGGSRALKNYVPDFDSELVKRFKEAGLIILGKTNTPEFGLMGITEPELHGPTRNPWNTGHTPGGSSGGSAAAVASGMVPVASAGDGGGSIRIPACYCGLFGLKPSRGRTPTGPQYGRIWQGAAVEHVISRSVRDSAAMLDLTCGPEPGAPYGIPAPSRPYLKEILQKPGKLKIAFSTESPTGGPVDPECLKAVEGAASLLEKLGHYVEEAAPNLDSKALAASYFMMYFGEMAADIDELRPFLGRKARRGDVELETWFFSAMGKVYSAGDFVKAIRLWDRAAHEMGNFHQKYDIYMTPTVASPPAIIGELRPKKIEQIGMEITTKLKVNRLAKATGMIFEIALKILSRTPFTQLANFTGQPAMSVPLHWTDRNMPLGVQFIAPFGDEATLFRLASQLEKAKPWFNKRPDISIN